jgi:hypothetical protein
VLNKTVLDTDVSLTGYNDLRSDRVGRSGGVTIFINNLNVSVSVKNI